jgi:DNA-cytosine methyltransferase
VYSDIREIKWNELQHVDILTGGFPCQDISTAGKQKGITGERSSLWRYYAKAIGVLRPRFALIENVPNLANLGLNEVLADIAKVGYDAEWFCLSASQFGALHKRERIFVITYPSGIGAVDFADAELTAEAQQSAQQGIDRCTQHSNSSYVGAHQEAKQEPEQSVAKNINGIGNEVDRRNASPLFVTDDWGKRIQRFRDETLQGKQGFSRFKDVRSVEELFKRPDIPQPLIRRGGNGFSSRLDSYLQKERTQGIGNAVVPQVAQFIARRIKECLNQIDESE